MQILLLGFLLPEGGHRGTYVPWSDLAHHCPNLLLRPERLSIQGTGPSSGMRVLAEIRLVSCNKPPANDPLNLPLQVELASQRHLFMHKLLPCPIPDGRTSPKRLTLVTSPSDTPKDS